MKGKFNPKTGKYDYRGAQIDHSMSEDDIQEAVELKQYEKIQSEGGTYLERYAKELDVSPTDLWKNILENNHMNRILQVKSYSDFKFLKQTLVAENNYLKDYMNILGKSFYDPIFGGKK
jgi:hypothetical protein